MRFRATSIVVARPRLSARCRRPRAVVTEARMPAFMARQGDVLIIEHHAGIPAECEALVRSRDGVVVADGEATGHRHRITSRDATLYEHPSGERFLRVRT